MIKYNYSFKTKPYDHQLASMGAILNHFKKGEKEFALLWKWDAEKLKS